MDILTDAKLKAATFSDFFPLEYFSYVKMYGLNIKIIFWCSSKTLFFL